jgi:hypothetical protein
LKNDALTRSQPGAPVTANASKPPTTPVETAATTTDTTVCRRLCAKRRSRVSLGA